MFLYVLIGVFVIVYVGLTLLIGVGFKRRLMQTKSVDHHHSIGLSIVVPFRNEAHHLPDFLKQLLQSALPDTYELILVNDDSTDNSVAICETYTHQENIQCINSHGVGKKQALQTGILAAQYNTILTLDADVLVSPQCIQLMFDRFHTENLTMLCGLVKFNPSNTLFEQLQAIESSVLIAYSALSLDHGMPSTCNGACLIFKRDVFLQLGAYESHKSLASGDDDLLMQSFYKASPNQVKFMNHAEAYVVAKPCSDVKSFMQQRLRWASKHKAYIYPYNAILSRVLILRFLLFWALIVTACVCPSPLSVLAILLILCSELISLKVMNGFFNCQTRYVCLLSLYFWYLPLMLLSVSSKNIQWKGRPI